MRSILPGASPLLSWTILLAAALAAGAANALVGGGTFLIFPAMILTGVPPIVANATSSVVVLPGGLASAWVYRRNRPRSLRVLGTVIAASLMGSAAGSVLLLVTPGARFEKLVPWLMLGAALLLTFGGPIRRFAEARTSGREHLPTLAAGQFLIALYGGYFGAGMGVLMIVLYLVAANMDVQASAAMRLMCGTTVNFVAVIIFAARGIILWKIGLPMTLAAIAGGYWGAHGVERLSAATARRIVLVYAWAMSIWLLIRAW
jgi:uncharacterized membrane protein YfcA